MARSSFQAKQKESEGQEPGGAPHLSGEASCPLSCDQVCPSPLPSLSLAHRCSLRAVRALSFPAPPSWMVAPCLKDKLCSGAEEGAPGETSQRPCPISPSAKVPRGHPHLPSPCQPSRMPLTKATGTSCWKRTLRWELPPLLLAGATQAEPLRQGKTSP